MEAKANAKFVRISPRKVNVVLDLVRGKDVKYAEAVLKHTPKASESTGQSVQNQQENFSHFPRTQGKRRRLRGG